MKRTPKFRIFSTLALAGLMALAHTTAHSQEPVEASRKVLTRVAPQYPSLARRMNIAGSVRLEVLVAPNGAVKAVEIKGGHPVLAQAAQMAVREWKYEAGSRETHELIEVKFNPE